MINYNDKIFRPISNTENGETSYETIFKYQQVGNISLPLTLALINRGRPKPIIGIHIQVAVSADVNLFGIKS